METPRSSKLGIALKIFLSLLASAVFAALVVTVFWFGAAYWSYGSLTDGTASVAGGLVRELLTEAAIAFVFVLAFAAAHVFVLGLPLLLLGKKLRLIRWWSCLLVSFLIGFIPASLAGPVALPASLAAGALGLLAGLAFWLLWRYWVQPAPGGGAGALPGQPASPGAADPSTRS